MQERACSSVTGHSGALSNSQLTTDALYLPGPVARRTLQTSLPPPRGATSFILLHLLVRSSNTCDRLFYTSNPLSSSPAEAPSDHIPMPHVVVMTEAMPTFAGLLAAAVSPLGAAAISVPQCETLSTATNGIQFCDVREGTGKSPAKGSLIRWVAEHASC